MIAFILQMNRSTVLRGCLMAGCATASVFAASGSAVDEQLRLLTAQNETLRTLVERQQEQIDALRGRLDTLDSGPRPPSFAEASVAPASVRPRRDGRVIISGEFGLSYFGGSSDAQYSNHEFRVDDSNLYIEAELARNLYAFGELHLSRREALDENFKLGELYLEWENVFGGALVERLVNLRFGRVDVPFGQEYLVRGPLKNPLITHSLADVWGTDEGVVVFGEGRGFDYAFAVQNGAQLLIRDHDSEKALTGRIGFAPTPRLRLSASALRTGGLDAANEPLSEVWIGNTVFRSIGSSGTTSYESSLWQVDARYGWRGGHVLGAYGQGRYKDNDPVTANTRRFTQFHLEAVQDFGDAFFGAIRYSSLRAHRGYPLAGLGNFNKYFLGNILTEDLWRLGAGVGYRFNRSALLKLELTREERTLAGGAEGEAVNQVSAQAALGF